MEGVCKEEYVRTPHGRNTLALAVVAAVLAVLVTGLVVCMVWYCPTAGGKECRERVSRMFEQE